MAALTRIGPFAKTSVRVGAKEMRAVAKAREALR